MDTDPTRRIFLATLPIGIGTIALGRTTFQPAADTEAGIWTAFPRQNPDLVREVVGASHSNEARVRELVGRHPALVNATWDWGFGDWETALGAASHTGRRAIAEFLLGSGARPDIFAAAMLGQLDTVKSMIAAIPGIQRNLGPHCIPLLAHAKAGGEQARPVVEFLEQLGDAGTVPESRKLSEQELQVYLGVYAFGPGESESLAVTQDKGILWIARAGESKHRLTCVGDHAFFPAGAPVVRVSFDVTGSAARSLSVVDGEVRVTATRR